jgi:hypothetical protein
VKQSLELQYLSCLMEGKLWRSTFIFCLRAWHILNLGNRNKWMISTPLWQGSMSSTQHDRGLLAYVQKHVLGFKMNSSKTWFCRGIRCHPTHRAVWASQPLIHFVIISANVYIYAYTSLCFALYHELLFWTYHQAASHSIFCNEVSRSLNNITLPSLH